MREGSASTTRQPDRYEENVVDSVLMAASLAPRLCPGCAHYHMHYLARRAARHTSGAGHGDALDRLEMMDFVAELLGDPARAEGSPIEIMLAGSADTGLLSTTANAAAWAGAVERVRFSVLDRCPTPLVLCAAFGRRHGLNVAIQTIDLLGSDRPIAADIIVLHSVLRFVPRERQVEFLNKLTSWLKPRGKIVFSMGLGKRSGEQSAAEFEAFRELFRGEVHSGRIPFPHSVDDFLATLRAHSPEAGDLTDPDSIRTLLRDANVRVDRLQEIRGDPLRRKDRTNLRILAVLSRPD